MNTTVLLKIYKWQALISIFIFLLILTSYFYFITELNLKLSSGEFAMLFFVVLFLNILFLYFTLKLIQKHLFIIFIKLSREKRKFAELSIRRHLIKEEKALELIQKENILLDEFSETRKDLSKRVFGQLILTNENLRIKEQEIKWEDLNDFRVRQHGKYSRENCYLRLSLSNKQIISEYIHIPSTSSYLTAIELIDKYWRNKVPYHLVVNTQY